MPPISHPRFDIGPPLGKGTFGTVYKAFDRERNTHVAIKFLHRGEARDRDRFRTEFRELSLLHHPNLPALYELFHHEGTWFFSMELVPGEHFVRYVRGEALAVSHSTVALSDTTKPPRELSPTQSDAHVQIQVGARSTASTRSYCSYAPLQDTRKLRTLLEQLFDTLSFVHSLGKVHRDIKPSNVLVRGDGRIFVLDFGLIADSDKLRLEFEGTPAYASPEQCLGQAVGPASDFYSVGVLLFESLHGERPFVGDARQLMLDKVQFEAPETALSGDRALSTLCNDLLSRDPARRVLAVDRYLGTSSFPRGTHTLRAPTAFVGRATELQRLHSGYETARGRQHAVLVEGPSAQGKSALVREFLAQIAEKYPDAPVFSGRASDRERVAFNAFDAIAEQLGRNFAGNPTHSVDLERVARLFPVMSHAREKAAADAPKAPTLPDLATRDLAFAALRRLLQSMAPLRPVLWIDDLQWADGDSAALLSALFREPFAPEVFFIFSMRTSANELPLPVHVERILLGPLPPTDVATLVDSLVDPSVSPERRRQMSKASGGVPLFAEELSRTLPSETIPSSLGAAITARIQNLHPPSKMVLCIVCLATISLRDTQLAEAAALAPELLLRILEELRARRLVRTEQFASHRVHAPFHDRIRETMDDTLTLDEKKAIHRAIARVLDSTQLRDAAPLVSHLRAAGEDEEAARFVLNAAERSLALLAYKQAASLYREAVLLKQYLRMPEATLRQQLAAALELGLLSREAAEEYVILADMTLDATDRSRVLEKACRLFLWSGELTKGLATLEALLVSSGESMPKTQSAALRALIAEQVSDAFGFIVENKSPAEALARYNLLRGVGEGLGMIDNVRGALFHTRAFRISRTLDEPLIRAEALGLEAIFRGCAGQFGRTRARTLLQDLRNIFPAGMPERAKAWHDVALAVTDMQGAPTKEATKRIEAAEQQFIDLQAGDAWAVSSCRLIRALTMRILGDIEGLRTVVPELLADADRRNDQYVSVTIGRGKFILWKADDVPELGWDFLKSQVWPRVSGSFHLQEWVGLEATCEMHLYEGRGMACWEEHEQDLRLLARAPFNLLIQSVRVLVSYLLGRLQIIRAHQTKQKKAALVARRYAVQLGMENASYAKVRSEFLKASLAAASNDSSTALHHIRRAEAHAAKGSLALSMWIARYLIGCLSDDPNGTRAAAAAEAALRAISIKNPARFVKSEVVCMDAWVDAQVARSASL